MQKSLTMPKLGMTMTEGTILQWFYKAGDFVEKDEALLEVMTDKVNIEVEAPFSGYLVNILAHEGEVLPVGAPLATLADEQAPLASASAQPVERSSTLSGDQAGRIASTPAAKREAALYGISLSSVVQAGATQPLDRADVLAFVQRSSGAALMQEQYNGGIQEAIRATPVAQRMAREHQIDLAELATLKPGGKITRSDVEAHLSAQAVEAAASQLHPSTDVPHQAVPVITAPVSQHGRNGNAPQTIEYELVPLSPVRVLIAQRMLNSFSSVPHIYLDTEIDMLEAECCRQQLGQDLQARGEKAPSLTAVVIRALAASLLRYPQVNASFAAEALQGKDAVRQWRVVHIGVAVDTGQALLTPVIRNAHLLSLPALSHELRRLTQAAHQGMLKPEELAGATFTVSNLGMYGIDTFHAIIAPGQGAILAVGKVTKRGVAVEDEQGERLVIRPLMRVSLSADHRILDGAIGSRFLQQFKAFLEHPYLLV
jgi:pyruvate dehydrogenase E2 component (dihydrolipoamide acetyltransferase)